MTRCGAEPLLLLRRALRLRGLSEEESQRRVRQVGRGREEAEKAQRRRAAVKLQAQLRGHAVRKALCTKGSSAARS